jgi:hypothetical protein
MEDKLQKFLPIKLPVSKMLMAGQPVERMMVTIWRSSEPLQFALPFDLKNTHLVDAHKGIEALKTKLKENFKKNANATIVSCAPDDEYYKFAVRKDKWGDNQYFVTKEDIARAFIEKATKIFPHF